MVDGGRDRRRNRRRNRRSDWTGGGGQARGASGVLRVGGAKPSCGVAMGPSGRAPVMVPGDGGRGEEPQEEPEEEPEDGLDRMRGAGWRRRRPSRPTGTTRRTR